MSGDDFSPETGADTAEAPNEIGDPAEFVGRYVPADVLARYEVYSYRNAALIRPSSAS